MNTLKYEFNVSFHNEFQLMCGMVFTLGSDLPFSGSLVVWMGYTREATSWSPTGQRWPDGTLMAMLMPA